MINPKNKPAEGEALCGDWVLSGVVEKCFICDNTRETTVGELNAIYHGPWICDECRKGIIWAKDQAKKAGGPG